MSGEDDRLSWFRVEYERAKKRNEQIPRHARMIVTNPDFWTPATEAGEANE